MPKNFTSTIAGASILITSVGIISKGFGFFREVIYANSFGLQTNFDIYLIGAVIPVTINSAIYFLAQNYFIPQYHKEVKEESGKGADFFNSSLWLFLILSIVTALILFLFSPIIIDAYLTVASNNLKNLAQNVFTIFLITIPFYAVNSILSAFLQSEFDFKSPAISLLFQNLFIIGLVFFFDKTLGVFAIPVGYLIGTIFQLIYLFIAATKKENFIIKKLELKTAKSWTANQIFIVIVLIEIIGQLYVLVDRYFYKSVDPGGIAALNYSLVLFGLPISIFSMALSTAIFPQLSLAVNKQDNKLLEGHFINSIRINLFLFIPVAFLFIYFGDYLIKIMYERGKFNSSDTVMTYEILRIFSISLIFYASYSIINKLIFSAGLIKQLLYITTAVFILKMILNSVLVQSFQQEGLAASTSFCYIFLSLVSYLLILSNFKFKSTKIFIFAIVFYSLNTFIAYVSIELLISLFPIYGLYKFMVTIIFFPLIYLINLYLIKTSEYLLIKGTFKNGNLLKCKRSFI